MKGKRAIWGLSAAHLITDLYSPVLPAILPLLISVHGYSYLTAGIIVTVFQLASSFTQPIVGWLYDKKGIAIHISYSVLFGSVFISAVGLVDSYPLILAFAAIGALGHAFFHPSALGTVSKLAEDSSRGRLTSYFVVGGNLGFAIGPVLAGAVVGLFGLEGMIVLVLPGLITAFVLKRILPPPAAKHADEGREMQGGSVPRATVVAAALLVFGSAFRAWAIFGAMAFLPTYLTERGLSVTNANLVVTMMLLCGVAGQVIGGTISDRYGRKEYTLFGVAAAIPPFWVFLHSQGTIAFVALFIFGFFLWSTFSVTVAMAHELVPGSVGIVSGLMLGLAVGAGGAGVAVSGYIADMFSLQFALFGLLAPIAMAFLLFLLVPFPWRLFGRMARSSA
ncbi:MAG: MFS transporter [Methanomicrobiaceae archaeon]|nr:MFS transporter [Methanomicrobiaceae archaeon]